MKKIRDFSLSGTAIRTCGMLFLLAGVIGSLLQGMIVGTGDMSNEALLQLMQDDSSVMTSVTMVLVLLAFEACAVPIFSFLLVEGVTYTSDFAKYLLRVFGLAVLTEIPYNLAISGEVLAFDSRNPVFGAALSLAMLYFFRRYPGKKIGNAVIKVFVFLAAVIWALMLGIQNGVCCVVITAVLWTLREKTNLRLFGGCIATMCCSVISPFYTIAAASFLILYFYNGEKGNGNRLVNYLCYPAILLVCGILSVFVL